jgi:GNAT superfamily N-acetyltransferase
MDDHVRCRDFDPATDRAKLESMLIGFEIETWYQGNLSQRTRDVVIHDIRKEIDRIGSGYDWCYIATYHDEAVGFNKAHLYNNNADKVLRAGSVELEGYVAQDYRRLGIGKQLRAFTIDSIKKLSEQRSDIKEIISTVEDSNYKNLGLIRSLGFQRIPGSEYTIDKTRRYASYRKKL